MGKEKVKAMTRDSGFRRMEVRVMGMKVRKGTVIGS